MPEDALAKKVVDRFSELQSARRQYEHNWQEIRDLVMPQASDFHRNTSAGDTRVESIYDGTAPQALVEFASGLASFLTNPTDRWFTIETEDMWQLQDDPEALIWLEDLSDQIYAEYAKARTGLGSALPEVYMHIGAFGTGVLNQEYGPNGLRFRAIPLSDCYIDESWEGKVDTLYREIEMTPRQVSQQFPDAVIPELSGPKMVADQKICLIHAVYPRSDISPRMDSKGMPFASVWVAKGKDVRTLRESGYRTFPYHVARWTVLPEETYGRGPGIFCLPDIKMLNRMEYTNIKAAAKTVDPPLQVPSDGVMMPIKTSPGSLIFKEPGSDPIEPLEFKGNWPVALELTNQKREFIRQCFFADWMRMEKETVEMTAYEVADRRDEKLRLLAPMLGRLMGELLSPMISRTYDLLYEAGKIRPAPEGLQGRNLKIIYVSPAARAQRGVKAVEMGRYLQELIPMAQVKPDIVDAVDTDAYAQELALVRGSPRRIIRSPEQIAAIREARARQEQAAMIAQTIEPASKAVKNLADANEKGNIF